MRTPFSIRLTCSSRPAILCALTLCASACNDTPAGPRALRRAPSPVIADSVYAHAIADAERALADLTRSRERSRTPAEDSLTARRIALLSKRIEGWKQRAASGGGLAREAIVDGTMQEGIIVDEETWTRVELTGWGATPLVTIQTTLDMPALLIRTVTGGSSTVKGHTYPVGATFVDFGYYAYRSFRLPEVDCKVAGALVDLSTFHTAEWFFSPISSSVGWARTVGKDSCPPVAPIPHFNLTAQGKTEENGDIFELTAPPGTAVEVKLTAANIQFDAPIKQYRWFKNKVFFAEGPSAMVWAGINNIGIALEVTDANGLKGLAEGVIALTYTDSTKPPSPPPPPTEDAPPGGGSDDIPRTEPPPQPPPPVDRYKCEEVFEKMRVDDMYGTRYYWEDIGTECGWVTTSRLPRNVPLLMGRRSKVEGRATHGGSK